MKKLIFLCIIVLGIRMYAQNGILTYVFSKATGVTYTPITGGTKLFPSGTNSIYNDEISSAIMLSSPFTMGGVTVDKVYVSTNGFITFGAPASPTNYTPLNTSSGDQGAISAFGKDGGFNPFDNPQPTTNPEIRYQDFGNEFVVQWQDHSIRFHDLSKKLNFQIRLNYTTGVINIIYGNCSGPEPSSEGPQVGIRGSSIYNVTPLTIYNIPKGTTCDWSNAVTGTSTSSTMIFSTYDHKDNIKIPSGLQYTWTPGIQSPVTIIKPFDYLNDITNNSAKVSWQAVSGATAYNIQYRTVGNCDWTNFNGNPISTTSATLTGLDEGTKYQIRIQALRGNIQSTYSHIAKATGKGGYSIEGYSVATKTTCPVQIYTEYPSNAPNSVTIKWYPEFSLGVPQKGYEYYYSLSPVRPTNNTIPSGSVPSQGPINSVTISGLEPATKYYYWIRGNCDDIHKGAWSDTDIVSTRSLCVPNPTVLNNTPGINLPPQIKWDLIPGTIGYQLKIGTTPGGNDVVDTNLAGDVNSYTINTPLASYTTYYFSIVSYTATSSSPTIPCSIFSFTTPCDPFNVPYSIDFENVSIPYIPACTSVTTTWKTSNGSAPFDSNTKVMRFNAIYDSKSWFFTNSINLTAGKTYNISFKYAKGGPYQEKLKVAYGTLPTAADMTNTIADYPDIVNNNVNSESINITPTTSGNYYLGFYIYSQNGIYYDLMIDDININEASTLNVIETLDNKGSIKIYPNPFSENITISDITNVKSISVVDIAGKLLKTFNKQNSSIDLKDLVSGSYMIILTMKDGSKQSVKIIKK